MNRTFYETVYLCRRPQCKAKHVITSFVYENGAEEFYKFGVGKTSEFPWDKVCRCGCMSFDLIYRKAMFEDSQYPHPPFHNCFVHIPVSGHRCFELVRIPSMIGRR